MNQKHYSQDLNKIVDSHCHLDFKDFDSDRDKIVNNAKLSNVDYLLTISVNLEDFEKVHEVTQNYENIWCTTVIHPNNVNSKSQCLITPLNSEVLALLLLSLLSLDPLLSLLLLVVLLLLIETHKNS